MEANVYDIGDTVVLRFVWTTKLTKGSITAGQTTLTVRDVAGYANTDPVIVEGAGVLGGDLVTTVQSISGNVLTLAAAAATSVSNATVGKLTSPTVATGKVRKPDKTVVPVTLTPVSAGVYEGAYDPDAAGDHWYRGEGTGAARAAGEKLFRVRDKQVA